MTRITFQYGGNVVHQLATRCSIVVTGATGTIHLAVIHRPRRPPGSRSRRMAGVTGSRGIDMSRRFGMTGAAYPDDL